MKFARSLIILSLIASLTVKSQKETYKWYFGNNCALDFSTGFPVNTTNGSTGNSTVEGCASISDATGSLLFYSNGETIWNKNHVVMANGSSIGGSWSSTQSSFIAKKPGSTTLYFVFTMPAAGGGQFGFSIVDMSLAGGSGSVTIKNSPLGSDMAEKLCGTMHCNNRDIWIVTHKYLSNEFYSYLLTATGVNTVPVISTVGSTHSFGTSFAGNMKISPTGKKLGLVIFMPTDKAEIFDFNSSTGQVSNPIDLTGTYSGLYGCEFSPDGCVFYATESAWSVKFSINGMFAQDHRTPLSHPIKKSIPV